MPNIGPLEIAIVAIIALLVFGPKRLPDLGRSLGRGINEFREGLSSIGTEEEDDDDLIQEDEDETTATPELGPGEAPAAPVSPEPEVTEITPAGKPAEDEAAPDSKS